ncbi:MAG: ATP-binding protein [Gemmatimonadales bacterium]
MTIAAVPALTHLQSVPQFEQLLFCADRATIVASLARGIAHDLRGPLQTLILLIDPHADLLSGQETGRLRSAVSEAVQHLTETIGSFSEVYAPAESEPAPVIVEDLLGGVADLQRYQRNLPAVEIELRLPGGLPPVRGEESMLRHLLLSLLMNAKQAIGPADRGAVVLAASIDNGMICLRVEDNGPGMPVALGATAFEPFVTTRPGALGIGLTVARWLARRHGGDLTLATAPGGGIAALVMLPTWRRGS